MVFGGLGKGVIKAEKTLCHENFKTIRFDCISADKHSNHGARTSLEFRVESLEAVGSGEFRVGSVEC